MFCRLTASVLITLVAITVPPPARSQDPAAPATIAGADDPAFQAAMALWLAGDDADAVPALAALAQQDNLAAQILLGTISDSGYLDRTWYAGLSAADRRSLLRGGDSPFGVPWLQHAAERSELAGLLGTIGASGTISADPAFRAAELGEPRSTARLLMVLVNQGEWAEAMRLAELAETYDMQALAWAAATHLRTEDAMALRAIGLQEYQARTLQGWLFATMADRGLDLELDALFAPFDDMRIYAVRGRLPLPGAEPPPWGGELVLDALLDDAPEAALLRTYCARVCGDAVAVCQREMYGLLFGYMTLPYVVSSPAETLIPQDVYLASRRADTVLEQFALGNVFHATDPAAAFEALTITQCLRDSLRPRVPMPPP